MRLLAVTTCFSWRISPFGGRAVPKPGNVRGGEGRWDVIERGASGFALLSRKKQQDQRESERG